MDTVDREIPITSVEIVGGRLVDGLIEQSDVTSPLCEPEVGENRSHPEVEQIIFYHFPKSISSLSFITGKLLLPNV